MKKIFLLLIFVWMCPRAQQPSSVEFICNGKLYSEVPQYTYFSDIDNTFEPYLGIWNYANGSTILTLRITKVTQYYFADEKIFSDYMVGDYKISDDGGSTYLTNTIDGNFSSNRDLHPLYTKCVENSNAEFTFEDLFLNKDFCYAKLSRVDGNPNQLILTLSNPKDTFGKINDNEPYNYGFSIPNNVLLTKQ